MSKPMSVDFPVVIPDLPNAEQFSEVAQENGYMTQITEHHGDTLWDVICVKRLVLTYEAVLTVQRVEFALHRDRKSVV